MIDIICMVISVMCGIVALISASTREDKYGLLFLVFMVGFGILVMCLHSSNLESFEPETIDICLEYDTCQNCYKRFNQDSGILDKLIDSGKCEPVLRGVKK